MRILKLTLCFCLLGVNAFAQDSAGGGSDVGSSEDNKRVVCFTPLSTYAEKWLFKKANFKIIGREEISPGTQGGLINIQAKEVDMDIFNQIYAQLSEVVVKTSGKTLESYASHRFSQWQATAVVYRGGKQTYQEAPVVCAIGTVSGGGNQFGGFSTEKNLVPERFATADEVKR